MSRTHSLPPELKAATENRLLRQRLRKVGEEAAYNQTVWRRFQERELSLLEAETLGELLSVLTDGMRRSFSLQCIGLLLLDPNHELRHLLLQSGKNFESFPDIRFLDGPHELPGLIRSLKRPWLGTGRPEYSILYPTGEQPRSVALLPMLRRNTLIGSLNLGSDDEQRFTRHHASDFLHQLAGIAAVCLENTTNREHLVISGLTDALTGLHNRRYLERRKKEEVARALRYNQPLSCLFVDVDHFKGINDRFGHNAGDLVLREVSLRIRECLRASDMAARYGGEEFALLLPQTDAEEALNLAERIRQRIAAHPIPAGNGEEPEVTVSVGASQLDLHSHADTGTLGTQLLQEADAALYLAKREGRNRVRMFEPE
jgi:two-component system cell cycle response regulator